VNVVWIEAFCEAAPQGSSSAAARSLGYTQSAVSRHIQSLEAAYGVTLVDRVPRGAILTEAGQAVLGHMQALLRRVEDARSDVARCEQARPDGYGWGHSPPH
jgi:DNA-binding transcriptional LysR family regulator